MKTIQVNHPVTFPLTQPEVVGKLGELKALRKERQQAEDEFASAKAGHKSHLAQLHDKSEQILRIVEDGCESRPVECQAELDFKNGTATILHAGKTIHVRPLTPPELKLQQEPLFDDGTVDIGNGKKTKGPKGVDLRRAIDSKSAAAGDKGADDLTHHSDDLDDPSKASADWVEAESKSQAEIREVMAQEKSKKTKRSAV